MRARLYRSLFGSEELRKLSQDNLKGRDQFIRAARLYLLHPVTLFTYFYPLTTLLTGLLIPEYTSLGLTPFASNLLSAAKVVLYWLFSWFALGRFAHVLLRLGLPFFMAPVLLWVAAVMVSQGVSLLVIADFEWSWLRIWRQAMLTIPATLVAVYAAAPILRETLGHTPELVPIWGPVTSIRVPLLLKLPPEHRSKVRRIHAANQYVEVVTATGTTMLRMGLKQAVEQLPKNMGWHCHRSLWINRDEVVALSFVKGQPQITDSEGNVFPVSRGSVAGIRDWLNQTRAPRT